MAALELLREFNQLGCKDQIKTSLACRVFQNLLANEKYCNIDKAYDKDLDILYVFAFDDISNDSRRHVFLPFINTQNLEMLQIERIQTKLKELYNECIVHLAICDTASNILFYTITSGFLDNETNIPRKR